MHNARIGAVSNTSVARNLERNMVLGKEIFSVYQNESSKKLLEALNKDQIDLLLVPKSEIKNLIKNSYNLDHVSFEQLHQKYVIGMCDHDTSLLSDLNKAISIAIQERKIEKLLSIWNIQ